MTMSIFSRGVPLVELVQEAVKVLELLFWIGSATAWPVAMCSAGMIEPVPLRTYSNSRRARPRRPRRPSRAAGRDTWGLRLGPVFSSMRVIRSPAAGAGSVAAARPAPRTARRRGS